MYTSIVEYDINERAAAQLVIVGGAERERVLRDEPDKRERVRAACAETRWGTHDESSTICGVSVCFQNNVKHKQLK